MQYPIPVQLIWKQLLLWKVQRMRYNRYIFGTNINTIFESQISIGEIVQERQYFKLVGLHLTSQLELHTLYILNIEWQFSVVSKIYVIFLLLISTSSYILEYRPQVRDNNRSEIKYSVTETIYSFRYDQILYNSFQICSLV